MSDINKLIRIIDHVHNFYKLYHANSKSVALYYGGREFIFENEVLQSVIDVSYFINDGETKLFNQIIKMKSFI